MGIDAINTEHLEMTNISLGEIIELRPFMSTAFSHLRSMQRAIEPDDVKGQQSDPESTWKPSVQQDTTSYPEKQESHSQQASLYRDMEAQEDSANNMDLF